MDVPITRTPWQKHRKKVFVISAVVIAVLLITASLSRMEAAAPSVDRGTLWVDSVKRGTVQRQVRGVGTLVPENIRLVPAATEARVERLVVLPGTTVKADTVIMELSNPQVEQAALEAEYNVKAGIAELNNQRVQLESAVLNQKAEAARAETAYGEGKMRKETDAELLKLGVISDLQYKVSQGNEKQLKVRSEIEQQRTENSMKAMRSAVAVQEARVQQLQALAQLRREQLQALKVRAGINGVLQQVNVQVGQQVQPGTNLARVADPTKLRAEVRIAETQAKDLQLGQAATVDTRNGVVQGKVTRIDPAVQNGTVTIDIGLAGELPRGARPDLSVDATIDLEALTNVVYVGRPASAQDNGELSLFKLDPNGETATRTKVRFGRSSVNVVEVLGGLKEGDQVVLSDTSRWDKYDRIRLQ